MSEEKSKVEQYLDTFKAFIEGAKERELEAFVNADSAQDAVTSIFIAQQNGKDGYKKGNQSGSGQAKSGNGADTETVTGTLQVKKDPERKVSKQGKKYVQYSLKVDDTWYNTIDPNVFKGAVLSVGDELELTLKRNGDFLNLVGVKKLSESSEDEDDIIIPF